MTDSFFRPFRWAFWMFHQENALSKLPHAYIPSTYTASKSRSLCLMWIKTTIVGRQRSNALGSKFQPRDSWVPKLCKYNSHSHPKDKHTHLHRPRRVNKRKRACQGNSLSTLRKAWLLPSYYLMNQTKLLLHTYLCNCSRSGVGLLRQPC